MTINDEFPILSSETRVFADLGWRVEMDRHGHFADFRLHEIEDDDPDFTFRGSIKWDGCSNWETNPDCMMHFCQRHQMIQFGVALARCYDWAAEFFEELRGK